MMTMRPSRRLHGKHACRLRGARDCCFEWRLIRRVGCGLVVLEGWDQTAIDRDADLAESTVGSYEMAGANCMLGRGRVRRWRSFGVGSHAGLWRGTLSSCRRDLHEVKGNCAMLAVILAYRESKARDFGE